MMLMSFEEYAEQFPIVVMCVSLETGNLLHMVGYVGMPSWDDREHLIEELENDEELGMDDLTHGEDYEFMIAHTVDVRHIVEQVLALGSSEIFMRMDNVD